MTARRSFTRPVDLQRLRYTPGQMLRSRDMRDQLSNDAQLRWWHNRALHSAFGVAGGFQATLTPDGQGVRIEPGVAYDCFGRELVLRSGTVVPLPAGNQDLTLLTRYTNGGGCEQHDPGWACVPAPPPRSSDQVEFVWQPSNQVGMRDGVPIAQLLREGAIRLDPTFHAPLARPLARPRIGSGATIPGGTPWEIWSLSTADWRSSSGGTNDFPTGLQVAIDATAAGFTDVPAYFAWLSRPLLDLDSLALSLYFSLELHYVEEATTGGFVFRLLIPLWSASIFTVGARRAVSATDATRVGQELMAIAQRYQLSVCWLGIQRAPGDDQGHERKGGE